jgi:hypothetical protein
VHAHLAIKKGNKDWRDDDSYGEFTPLYFRILQSEMEADVAMLKTTYIAIPKTVAKMILRYK